MFVLACSYCKGCLFEAIQNQSYKELTLFCLQDYPAGNMELLYMSTEIMKTNPNLAVAVGVV